MTDQQLAALAGYLRARFSDQPPWDNVERDVRDARADERGLVRPTPGSQSAPANPTQREKPW
jgi:hypothetical protein